GFDFDNILSELFGKGRGNGMRFSFGGGTPFDGYQRQQKTRSKGADLVYELPLTLEEVATGTSKTVSYQHHGRSEKITVKIPKGMISGKKLRVAGKGDPDPYGGPPGDLYIQSKVLGDKVYDSKGYDLYMYKEIKLSEALLGSSISVPTLGKKELSLKIPPGTKHKTKMRLAGHGLPHMNGKDTGDLYVYIQLNMPVKLTKKQKKLIEQLAEVGL
ncbi:MAG: J domain-containing protein, partial [Deltaproteobacteria bacterium]|nr:J domain-containing protein [Deltaproteobacteria bacterium]